MTDERRHRSLQACIESLVNRLETIKESNPEIHLDDDIFLARRAIGDHRALIEGLQVRAAQARGLIYLASPYSHPDEKVREWRFHQACKAAGALIQGGLFVFSPIAHGHPIAQHAKLPTDWKFWEAYSRTILRGCSRMMVLAIDGWESSVGVSAETDMARKLGLPVEIIEHNES